MASSNSSNDIHGPSVIAAFQAAKKAEKKWKLSEKRSWADETDDVDSELDETEKDLCMALLRAGKHIPYALPILLLGPEPPYDATEQYINDWGNAWALYTRLHVPERREWLVRKSRKMPLEYTPEVRYQWRRFTCPIEGSDITIPTLFPIPALQYQ